jgi:uncharacterized protein GlcG (DUF336 family)
MQYKVARFVPYGNHLHASFFMENIMKNLLKTKAVLSLMLGSAVLSGSSAMAACTDITRDQLSQAVGVAKSTKSAQGGYGLAMWTTMVDETGKVCYVVTDGASGALAGNSEWLGSRVISAQKANTANAFSLDGYAISTANLYSAVQEGGSLYGLQHSNPVDASVAYLGSPSKYGTDRDPLTRKRIGGVNVFGGGLALYKGGKKIGAIGVSGDTSCRDHAYAWRVRTELNAHPTVGITNANFLADGTTATNLATGTKGDEMIINVDGTTGTAAKDYWDAWSQPACPNSVGASLTNSANALANGQLSN